MTLALNPNTWIDPASVVGNTGTGNVAVPVANDPVVRKISTAGPVQSTLSTSNAAKWVAGIVIFIIAAAALWLVFKKVK